MARFRAASAAAAHAGMSAERRAEVLGAWRSGTLSVISQRLLWEWGCADVRFIVHVDFR
jgi:hypothetical protein